MHQGPGNWVAITHAVVYNALAAHILSAGIKYRHCTTLEWLTEGNNEPPTSGRSGQKRELKDLQYGSKNRRKYFIHF